MNVKKVALSDIRIDGGTQGRVVIDQNMVYDYLACMKDGDEFPRMFAVYDGTTYWLVDGFHRYHAYKLLNLREIEIDYKPGTLQEAQVMSFGVNGKHGKPRTNDDKRKVVESALQHPLTKHKSDYEIAKICCVSRSFVGSIKNPETKKKQSDSKSKHTVKKAKEIEGADSHDNEKRSQTTLSEPTDAPNPLAEPNPHDGDAPSREEIEAAEDALRADQEMMYEILESDDKLKVAMEENARLNLRVAQLEARLRGLMNERNEAVKLVKTLQKQLDKLKEQNTWQHR